MPLPRARREHLSIEELPEETLVFDHLRQKAHCLNRTTALIWRHCDGRTTVADLAGRLENELSRPQAKAVVRLALEQLAGRHLLEGTIERPSTEQRRSRRELLRRLAAASLPAILTVTAPRASSAASPSACTQLPDFYTCATNMWCCQGKCIAPLGRLGSACTADCQCGRGLNCFNGVCSAPA